MVCLFQLIPKEEVCLTELEAIKVVGLHDRDTKYVGRGEKPASARSLLIGDGTTFDWYLDVKDRVGVCDDGRRALQDRIDIAF